MPKSVHVTITKIEKTLIPKNAILFDLWRKITKLSRKNRFRTVASLGACGRLAVLNWRSSSTHVSSWYMRRPICYTNKDILFLNMTFLNLFHRYFSAESSWYHSTTFTRVVWCVLWNTCVCGENHNKTSIIITPIRLEAIVRLFTVCQSPCTTVASPSLFLILIIRGLHHDAD